MSAAERPGLTGAKRIVIKIGSALLVEQETGAIHRKWLDALADDVAALRAAGAEVLIVSSGAIAVGRRHLGLTHQRLKLEEKQAAAATGQIRLAHAYQETLARHGITVAQVLLTIEDTEARRRHLNARSTLLSLLGLGVVPVINENDTVATSEIRFGDNDRLAARVSAMVLADALVLLSDIDGLYDSDPKRNPGAAHLAVVETLTPQIEAMAGEALPGYSSGGMVTKLAAARVATAAGCRMAIADGRGLNPIASLLKGGRSTWFMPQTKPLAARKQWIAGTLKPEGKLVVDDGARRALEAGKSLLPAGVVEVTGAFERGDAIIVADRSGEEIARGLSAYSAADAARIAGHKSREIETLLGYRGRDEMIHRDDLVLSRR